MHKRFRWHLENLLPLQNPSGKLHPVITYTIEQLKSIGRTPVLDKHNNILALADHPLPRGIVAHTDSVGQYKGKDREGFEYRHGNYHSVRFKRPIGGDDKVGVAIALTLAEQMPDISVILPADEEIGCVGSSKIELPQHDLLVQCDRRGANDLVNHIWEPMTSKEFDWVATDLLPHRELVHGMMTDVEQLCWYSNNSVNMSCGYFNPHSVMELINWKYACQALEDAATLLTETPYGLEPREVSHYTGALYGRSWPESDLDDLFDPDSPAGRGLGYDVETDEAWQKYLNERDDAEYKPRDGSLPGYDPFAAERKAAAKRLAELGFTP